MLPHLSGSFANAASIHRAGQRSRRAVEEAREAVAHAIGATGGQVIFTSGATEADNLALRAVMATKPGGHLVTSVLEHPAVLETARFLERTGVEVSYIEPDRSGAITALSVRGALRPETALVALMQVNNETGIVTDVSAVSELTREAGVLLFCDAVQGFGSVPVSVVDLGADLLSLSGHKVYGPKGVGTLYLRDGLDLGPILYGGGQERGLRPGTLNTAAIVGMGRAAELASANLMSEPGRLVRLRDRFERAIVEGIPALVIGADAERGPRHSCIHFPGVDGQAFLMNLDLEGVMASLGSACSAGSPGPSHVLTAMGLTEEEARSSVRFSFGSDLTAADIDLAAERVLRAARRSLAD